MITRRSVLKVAAVGLLPRSEVERVVVAVEEIDVAIAACREDWLLLGRPLERAISAALKLSCYVSADGWVTLPCMKQCRIPMNARQWLDEAHGNKPVSTFTFSLPPVSEWIRPTGYYYIYVRRRQRWDTVKELPGKGIKADDAKDVDAAIGQLKQYADGRLVEVWCWATRYARDAFAKVEANRQ